MSATAAPLITVEKVNKHFGAAHVLKDVTTSFNAGEVAVKALSTPLQNRYRKKSPAAALPSTPSLPALSKLR